MNLKETQLMIEKTFSRKAVQQKHESQWDVLLDPMETVLLKLNMDEDDVKVIRKNMVKLLYILADRPNGILYHNLMEILMNSSYRDDVIMYYGKLLDMGVQFKFWKYDQIKAVNDFAMKVIPNYLVTNECAKDLAVTMYHLPMLLKPEPVANHGNNKGSGYLLETKDSLISGNRWHNKPICREYLDILNGIAFEIVDIRTYFEHKFNKEKAELNLIETASTGITINVPKKLEELENNWKTMLAQTNVGMKILKTNPIYLVHKYDYRGRVYCSGYHFNYQGDSYNKASLQFHNKSVITDEINFNIKD